jgi:hypothetical protein
MLRDAAGSLMCRRRERLGLERRAGDRRAQADRASAMPTSGGGRQ